MNYSAECSRRRAPPRRRAGKAPHSLRVLHFACAMSIHSAPPDDIWAASGTRFGNPMNPMVLTCEVVLVESLKHGPYAEWQGSSKAKLHVLAGADYTTVARELVQALGKLHSYPASLTGAIRVARIKSKGGVVDPWAAAQEGSHEVPLGTPSSGSSALLPTQPADFVDAIDRSQVFLEPGVRFVNDDGHRQMTVTFEVALDAALLHGPYAEWEDSLRARLVMPAGSDYTAVGGAAIDAMCEKMCYAQSSWRTRRSARRASRCRRPSRRSNAASRRPTRRTALCAPGWAPAASRSARATARARRTAARTPCPLRGNDVYSCILYLSEELRRSLVLASATAQ